ncbi:hypothetical protein F8M41_009965 [Gigaspora margarita]|uniref:Uncharacterized protein n=1 Tax=Gigaspora margarita TaxID=4874 RepID=A0A8H4EV66_GIGMA|nr:hypothetical protein F8M41_009965 [Gigaspora margarita]
MKHNHRKLSKKEKYLNDLMNKKFTKNFEIAQKLYEQEKLTRQVYTIVNDFFDEIFHFENDGLPDSQIFQFEELKNGYEAFEEFIEYDEKK